MTGLNLDNSPNFQLLTPLEVQQLNPGDCFYWCSPVTGWTRCWVRRVIRFNPLGESGLVRFWLDEDAVLKADSDICTLTFDQMFECGVLK
jgi:hypothetical protein